MTAQRDTTIARTAPVRRFAVEAAITLAIFTTLVFIGIFWRTASLIRDGAREQASSYIDLVVDARAWNAHYEGVWVTKRAGVESNRYLRKLGVEPDTRTVSGQMLTLRNPAVMTSEISQIAHGSVGVTFKLTSLTPVNPSNAPDAWERAMLERFPTDRSEVARIERGSGGRVLRVLRPLVVDESCLACHAKQGYRVGDIRGAVSVRLPLAANDRAIYNDGLALAMIFVSVAGVGGSIGYLLVDRMARRVEDSERQLQALATTDPLTGISNRRAVLEHLERELVRAARTDGSVGVIEMDIDHFKLVNDRHGHAAGDTVLREVTARMSAALREYDTVGRLGGEEFLVVAPELDGPQLAVLAERLRAAVSAAPITNAESEVLVTVSGGATISRPDDTPDTIVARADDALYAAKAAGRNRVETA